MSSPNSPWRIAHRLALRETKLHLENVIFHFRLGLPSSNYWGPITYLQLMLDSLSLTCPVFNQPPVGHPNAFNRYSRYFDTLINTGLRTGKMSDRMYRIFQEMESDLQQLEPVPPMVLFRGVRYTPGEEFTDLGFMSKTCHPEMVFSFIQLNQGHTLLVLNYPQPSRQLNMRLYSHFPEEDEMLSLPGERFLVRARLNLPSINIVYCDFVDFVPGLPLISDNQIDRDYQELYRIVFFSTHLFILSTDFDIPVCGQEILWGHIGRFWLEWSVLVPLGW